MPSNDLDWPDAYRCWECEVLISDLPSITSGFCRECTDKETA